MVCVQLRVAPSQAKNKLFIGNIPKGYDQAEVERQLKLHVKGGRLQSAVELLKVEAEAEELLKTQSASKGASNQSAWHDGRPGKQADRCEADCSCSEQVWRELTCSCQRTSRVRTAALPLSPFTTTPAPMQPRTPCLLPPSGEHACPAQSADCLPLVRTQQCYMCCAPVQRYGKV